jgi:hypothetical protein
MQTILGDSIGRARDAQLCDGAMRLKAAPEMGR